MDRDMVVAFGHQFPNFTYGAEVGVYDLRMYVGPALSADQVPQQAVGGAEKGFRRGLSRRQEHCSQMRP